MSQFPIFYCPDMRCVRFERMTGDLIGILIISDLRHLVVFAEYLCNRKIESIVMYRQLHKDICDNKSVLLMMGLFNLSQLYLHP